MPRVCQRLLRGDIKMNKTEYLPSRNSAQKMGRLSVLALPQHFLSSRSDFGTGQGCHLCWWTAPSPGAWGGGATADPAPGCFSCPLCLECGKIPTGSGLGGKGSWAAAWLPRELTRKGYLPFVSILYVSISLGKLVGGESFVWF